MADSSSLFGGGHGAPFTNGEDVFYHIDFGDVFIDRHDATGMTSVDASGNTGHVSVISGSGHDSLILGSNDDTASGGAGNDHIAAGSGNNLVYGEAGNELDQCRQWR